MRRLIPALLVTGRFAFAAGTVEFNRDVRPILSDKCFHCHGPDAATRKIPLRLDSESAAKADLGGRRAIAEGRPEASELVRRITASGKPFQMPPAYSGLKLTAAEIETLRAWIAQGAKWQRHWSFLAPVRPELPPVKRAEWARNPVDRFVLERLESEGLAPSPEAGRETLLRRVSLDITGLPPTPAETAAFLADASSNAYEKAVDRLLASPRYGERMAARWLDAARYADSNGYQFDGEREMWRWRDWVIAAFNRNQPFDQFTLEQVAGDMLPNATLAQRIATGFNRNHRANTEDGIIPEEYAVEYVVDRIETTSAVFLGLTLGCARCHNHKYDPFTQKEFYQIFAYFNNVPELGRAMKYGNSPPLVAAPTEDQQRALDAVNARIATREAFLRERGPAPGAAVPAPATYWSPPSALDSAFPFDEEAGEGRFGKAAAFDGSRVIEAAEKGAFDIDDRFTLSAWVNADAANGAILTRMIDRPRGKGYGVYLKDGAVHVHLTSNYDDDAIRIDTERKLEPGSWRHIAVTYDGSRVAAGVNVFVDGEPAKTTVSIDTLYRPFRNAGARYKEPLRIGGGGGPANRFRGRIDEVRVYARILSAEEIGALADLPHRRPFAARSHFLETGAAPDVRDAWRDLASLRLEREKLERTFPTVMVMAERPSPKDTFLLVRGAYNAPGEKVQPGVPGVLPPLPEDAPNNRLGFARWLIDARNPLLARVTVNRFWQMYFGTGIVKTTEDFGQQGEWPSHPALLDWLATEFIRAGWDVKALQKLIVTSAAYRQSSKSTPELQRRDPDNRLLARGPRSRLPAEMIRDQALYASGLLAEKTGGRSVMPYQPAGLWKDLAMQDMEYAQSRGEDLHRRSLYTFWKRTIAPPMMVNFDAANREACVVRETRTNTPLQALNLMNDVTFLEAARFIAQRMMKAPDPLPYGFRLVTGRTPSERELDVLRGSFRYHLDYFSNGDKARAFLEQGETPGDASLDRRQLSAYASVASLLLNLDETVTKE
jgi:hypothetical protein